MMIFVDFETVCDTNCEITLALLTKSHCHIASLNIRIYLESVLVERM